MSIKILNNLSYKSSDKYRAVLTEDFIISLDIDQVGSIYFCNDKNKIIAKLFHGILTISKGYASDLCSPAFKVSGKWFGVPSGPKEVEACVIHDCLRQLTYSACCPWDRNFADKAFYEVLKFKKSSKSALYYIAVSSFIGDTFSRWKKNVPLICK